MNFRTNLNKFSLLSNYPISIEFENKIVKFIPPSMNLFYNDLNFIEFKFLLRKDPKSIDINLHGYKPKTEYELFLIILKSDYKTKIFLFYFLSLFPNLIYEHSTFLVDGVELTNEEYLVLLDALDVSCGEKDINSFLPKEKEEEENIKEKNVENNHLAQLAAKMKANEDKLNQLKQSKQQKKQSGLTIDQIVTAILYEFPSFKLDDILRMNVFSVLYLWSHINKVIDTQIQITAAGNGLIKNFTYFIN